MRIGIDIDGCLCDDDEYRLAYIFKYCDDHNLPTPDMPYGYEYKATWWGHEHETGWRDEYFDDYMENVPVRYGVLDIFRRLMDEGHEIILITGRWPGYEDSPRGMNVRERTQHWLVKNRIPYDKLVFTSFPKIEYIKKENIDVMVEDFDETISDCVKYWPTFCYDNRYNVGKDMENMTRFFSWYDFYRKFHEQIIKDR